jgi:hypothetical protein
MAKVDPKIYRKKRGQSERIKSKLLRAAPMIAGFVLVLLALWGLNPGGIFTRGNVEVAGKPELKADQELIDLGDVKLGETVSAAFQITNVGDKTLEFTKKPYVEIVEGC